MTRRILRQYAAQTVNIDATKAETFVFDMVTSISNLNIQWATPGRIYVFILIQNAKGNHAINWGAQVSNASNIDPTPSAITVQAFIAMTGGGLWALSAATWTEA